MSLRTRLFILFGGLVAVLLGAQWWMLRSLAHDLEAEVEAVAVAVGESIVKVLQDEHLDADGFTSRSVQVQVIPKQGSAGPGGAPPPAGERVTRVIRRIHQEDGSALTEEEAYRLGDDEGLMESLRRLDAAAASLLLEGPDSFKEIPIPMNSLEKRVQGFTRRILAGTGALLLLGLVVAGLFAHGITRPLRQLARAARQVGEGELGARVEGSARGEVGETLQAFNQMSDRLRQLEEDTRRLRAGQHLSELGEVSRGLAHSLRNPLNALGLSLDRLADGDLAPGDRQWLATTARQQIRRVDASLRSFLALASSGTVAEEDVDVAALIQDVALEALQSCHATGADSQAPMKLETEIEPDLPALRGVQPELRAVLQALMVNALEASPPGGRIRLRASAKAASRLTIEVEDEGPGLPAEVRERLFSPHVTTKEQGSGMGLFLAQRIAVNRYGGSLRLEDVDPPGEGSSGTRAVLEIGPRHATPAVEPR